MGRDQGGPNRQGEQMKNRDELICAIFWKPQVLNPRSNGGDVSMEPWGTSQETGTAGSRCLSLSLTCPLTLSPHFRHSFSDFHHQLGWSDWRTVIVTCPVLDIHRHLWPEVAVLPVTLGSVLWICEMPLNRQAVPLLVNISTTYGGSIIQPW